MIRDFVYFFKGRGPGHFSESGHELKQKQMKKEGMHLLFIEDRDWVVDWNNRCDARVIGGIEKEYINWVKIALKDRNGVMYYDSQMLDEQYRSLDPTSKQLLYLFDTKPHEFLKKYDELMSSNLNEEDKKQINKEDENLLNSDSSADSSDEDDEFLSSNKRLFELPKLYTSLKNAAK